MQPSDLPCKDGYRWIEWGEDSWCLVELTLREAHAFIFPDRFVQIVDDTELHKVEALAAALEAAP